MGPLTARPDLCKPDLGWMLSFRGDDPQLLLPAADRLVLGFPWRTPGESKSSYGNASIIGDNRVVFNIKGNDYRLVDKLHYNRGIVYVRFVGTHREYDRIDAETI